MVIIFEELIENNVDINKATCRKRNNISILAMIRQNIWAVVFAC